MFSFVPFVIFFHSEDFVSDTESEELEKSGDGFTSEVVSAVATKASSMYEVKIPRKFSPTEGLLVLPTSTVGGTVPNRLATSWNPFTIDWNNSHCPDTN